MATKTAGKLTLGFANFFGGIGYIFLILEWLLVILAYFYWIQTLPFLQDIKNATPPPIPEPVAAAQTDDSLFLVILGVIITVIMIVIAIYAFVKLPSMIVKASKRVVHRTAEFTAPAALHIQHKKDTKKNRIKIAPRLVVILKIIFIVIAAGLIYGSQFLPEQKLEFSIMVMSGVWLLGLSAAFFGVQYLVAKLLRVDARLLW